MTVPELRCVENDTCNGKCVADIGGDTIAVGRYTVSDREVGPGDRMPRVITSAS